MLHLKASMIVAVDTGGTKTLIASFDSNGIMGEHHRFETPKDQNDYLKVLISTLREHYEPAEVEAIVIGVPGVVANETVLWCGNLPWSNFSPINELSRYYSCPIWLHNDADLAGLAEANAISPVPKLCLYVTISTGIGSGIIINGKLTPELRGSEAGHMLLEYDGRLQAWESFASGRTIHTLYGKYAYEITDKRIWNKIADTIARGFAALLPPLQPEVVVIGGSIGTHFEQYEDTLNKLVNEMLPSHIVRPQFIKASHPEEAVIYGCYYHAVHQLAN